MNDKVLPFNVGELNKLISLILTNVASNGTISQEEGLVAKRIFNTLVDICLNNTDMCRELLNVVDSQDDVVDSVKDEAASIIKGILS